MEQFLNVFSFINKYTNFIMKLAMRLPLGIIILKNWIK